MHANYDVLLSTHKFVLQFDQNTNPHKHKQHIYTTRLMQRYNMLLKILKVETPRTHTIKHTYVNKYTHTKLHTLAHTHTNTHTQTCEYGKHEHTCKLTADQKGAPPHNVCYPDALFYKKKTTPRNRFVGPVRKIVYSNN